MPDVTLDQASTNHASMSLVWIDGPSAVSALPDPGVDGLMGWDESADDAIWFTAGTGLEFSTTTLQIDSTVTTLTGTQTLTNKTLTSPVLGGTVTGTYTLGGTITYDSQPALLAGRSGGQELIGGTGSGDDLTLTSTSHGTLGVVTTADQVTLTRDSDLSPLVPTLTVGNASPASGNNFAQTWSGFTTDLNLFEINSDDWLFANNAIWNETVWSQPTAGSPSTLYFMASGGRAHRFYTVAADDLAGSGWTQIMSLEGARSGPGVANRVYIGADDTDLKAFPAVLGLTIETDDGDGTTSTRAQQIDIRGTTDGNDLMEIGLDTDGIRDPFGVINVLTESSAFHDLILTPGGGNVGVGAVAGGSTGEKLHVVGNTIITGYHDITEIATPSDPGSGVGRLYAATDGTLHFINDASLDIELGVAGGGGLANIVEDTTPQIGGSAGLDMQGQDILSGGVIFMTEQAAAEADVAGDGQLWIKTATPNQFWFTDDAGTDAQVSLAGHSHTESDISDLQSYLVNVVEDTTPQLGGMLDVNGNGFGDGTLELLSFTETGSAVNEFTIANAATGNDPVLSATGDDAAVGIVLTPKGTGNITLGTMVLDADQTIGAGQDNYVLTYDNSGGLISLEASAGGGLSNVVDDTTPQIGGTAGLDMQGQDITSGGVVFLTEQAAAEADVAGQGQLWVKNDTPNVLYFTDDVGTDHVISAGIEVNLTTIGDNEIIAYDTGGAEFINRTMGEWFVDELTDPNADRLLFWDDSATDVAWLTLGAGLSTTTTTLNVDIVGDTTPQLGGALDGQGNDLNNLGVVFLTEQAAAEADVAGKGQLWIKTATPNQLWFTDDAGTDVQLGQSGGLSNVVEDTTPQLGGQLDVNGNGLGDGTNVLLDFVEDASAVNYIQIENEATGNPPFLRAVGTDTNINLHLQGKGSGVVLANSVEVATISATQTLTNKTINAANNTLSLTADSVDAITEIAAALKSGADGTLITGTAGTNGDLAAWNADGDLVDGPTPPAGTIVGTSDAQTLTNKTLTSPTINGASLSGTLSGTPTYSGGINISASQSYDVAGTAILSDAAGTMTLSNVDALDATTEATVEAAIDSLANLTSIQSLTVTLADAGADAILGWDDTASAYENLTQAEVLAVIGSSSDTAQGVIEVATEAEINTGTDDTRAISPDSYQGSNRNLRYISVVLVEPGTDVATATSIIEWAAPFAGTIIQDDSNPDQFAAYTTTAGTTGTMVVDVHLNGTTIMTTNKLDIETTEKDTTTAATQPDLTTTSFSAGDVFTWDIDAVHSGTAGKGCHMNMTVRPT